MAADSRPPPRSPARPDPTEYQTIEDTVGRTPLVRLQVRAACSGWGGAPNREPRCLAMCRVKGGGGEHGLARPPTPQPSARAPLIRPLMVDAHWTRAPLRVAARIGAVCCPAHCEAAASVTRGVIGGGSPLIKRLSNFTRLPPSAGPSGGRPRATRGLPRPLAGC